MDIDSDILGAVDSKRQVERTEDGHYSSSDIEILNEDRDSSDCSIDAVKTGSSKKCVEADRDCHSKNPGVKISNGSTEIVDRTEIQGRTDSKVHGDNNMCASYKEISSDSDDDDIAHDDDVTEKIEDDSSTSSLSQISPNHRIQYQDSEDTSDCAVENLPGPSKHSSEHSHSNDSCHNKSFGSDTEKLLSPDSPEAPESAERPDSLSLPRPLQYYERHKTHRRELSNSSLSGVSQSSSTDALIEEASKTPLHKQGSVTKEGDMIAFVADGLNDMIKMSSPLSRTSGSMSGSLQSPGAQSNHSTLSSGSASAWSDVTSSASEWSRDYSRMSRRQIETAKAKRLSPSILTASPDDIPPVDPRALMDVEFHARKVAGSLNHMLESLQNNLYKMSALSYHCLDAYKDGVDHTCDSVDTSIKSMYAMMAKCEELSKAMQPTYKLHAEIKEIQRLLDKFENEMVREDK